jgi:hypothetical protein
MGLAILAGLVSACIGGLVWAVVTAITKYQIGWMAVGIGFLVGLAVRVAGKGIDQKFAVVGAACAFLGCALGNLLSIFMLVAFEDHTTFNNLLANLDFSVLSSMMTSTFQGMDLLFYGIAMYEGYKFSLRDMTAVQA